MRYSILHSSKNFKNVIKWILYLYFFLIIANKKQRSNCLLRIIGYATAIPSSRSVVGLMSLPTTALGNTLGLVDLLFSTLKCLKSILFSLVQERKL